MKKFLALILLTFLSFTALCYCAGSAWAKYQKNDHYNSGASSRVDTLKDIKEEYLGTDGQDVSSKCWYCTTVVVVVNTFMKVAANALPIAQELARIILKYGFLVWLAYYLLQQVSSMSPTSPGKMLQEVLVMGFKVALAYVVVGNITDVIATFFLNPIVGLGVDYGNEVMNGLMEGS